MADAKTIGEHAHRHLLVCFSERWAPSEGTIVAHENIIAEYGHVWLAKFGRRVGNQLLAQMRRQLAESEPTFVVMLRNEANWDTTSTSVAAAFRIVDVQTSRPAFESSTVPAYYGGVGLSRGAWFKSVNSFRLSRQDLTKMRVPRSQYPLSIIIQKSMARHFWLDIDPILIDHMASSIRSV